MLRWLGGFCPLSLDLSRGDAVGGVYRRGYLALALVLVLLLLFLLVFGRSGLRRDLSFYLGIFRLVFGRNGLLRGVIFCRKKLALEVLENNKALQMFSRQRTFVV